MLFRLAFNKTMQGTLRVSATTVRGSDHVLSIYDNDEAFTRLLEHSELDAESIGSLKGRRNSRMGRRTLQPAAKRLS